MQKFKEIFMHIVFLLAAFVSIAAVLLICVFLFIRCKVSATHEICVVLTFFYALFFPPLNQRMSSHPFSGACQRSMRSAIKD